MPDEVMPPTDDQDSAQTVAPDDQVAGKFPRLKRLGRAYWKRKKWTLPVTLLLLIIALLAIPFTRYVLLGTFVHGQAKISVYDATSHKPVSGADISVGSARGKTDLGGNLILRPKLGNKPLAISKKYYSSSQQKVTIGWPSKLIRSVGLTPTGRLVPISLTNKLTGKPLANVLIKSAGTETRTDKKGKSTIVLPTTAATQQASVSLNGYNTAQITIQVTDQMVAGNNFTLTPGGKLYFLSNQSGKIDVIKTSLDGSDRQTVFAGTGSEDAATTSLLASRDWKYLMLLAKHGANSQSLYLINTTSDQVTNVDGGSSTASFNLVGWSNDSFVYQVSRSNVTNWQDGAQVLKSYNAGTSKLYTIDQTQGEGTSNNDYAFNNFSSVYLLSDELVYAKNWSGCCYQNHLSGKSVSLVSAKVDGSNKHSVKDFPIPDSSQYSYYVNLTAYEPQSVYVQVPAGDNTNAYYEYEAGKLSAKSDVSDDIFNKAYPTFLISPSGNQTFWSELRDNKNTLFIGSDTAKNQKQIAALSDYTPYGWYSDNYLLVSKNGSELYVMASDGSGKARKITDYYKPQVTYRGYGGGYGGQ